jgi:hypothetical protein
VSSNSGPLMLSDGNWNISHSVTVNFEIKLTPLPCTHFNVMRFISRLGEARSLLFRITSCTFSQKMSHSQLCYISWFGDLSYKFRPVMAIIRLLYKTRTPKLGFQKGEALYFNFIANRKAFPFWK